MAERIAEDVRRLLGAEGLLDEERPVALPSSAAEASELMKLASARRWKVAPVGARTWLGSPRGAQLFVGTDRLAALHSYEPADPMASVGAGMALARLAAECAPQRQWLPLDPPGDARSTVGAAVALGAAGPLRHGYGTAREHVLGLELVTGDGRVLQLGGKVLKNVAGYDLTRLVAGSRGALGLITRVHFKLRPMPEVDETVSFSSLELSECLSAARVAASRPEAAAVELLSTSLSEIVTGAARWTVLVRLQGEAEAVGAAKAALSFGDHTRGTSTSLSPPTSPFDLAQADRVWPRLAQAELTAATVRLADRPSALASTLGLARELGPAHVAAHAGDGIVRVFLSQVDDAAVTHARAALERSGGSVLVLPPAGTSAFGKPTSGAKTMRELKKAFDPHDVLWDGGFDFLTG